MYFKVIQDDKIIDVLSDIVYVRKQVVHNRLIACDKDRAEGVLSSNGDNIWFVESLIETNINDYPIVKFIEIEQEEFEILKAALDNGQEELDNQVDNSNNTEVELSEDELMTIDFIRAAKINEMSKTCNQIIIAGFDVELSDKEVHHFDLSLEEQLNFISLKDMINGGATEIPYHAANEPCKFYSAEDILKVIETGTMFKTYHVTYFNSLKQYILSLNTIDDITAVVYGMQIPQKYYSEVMIALTKASDDNE